jgi:uncharacterized membrane protein
MRNQWTVFGLTALLWIAGGLAMTVLPDPAPMHWNALGEVDGWGPRWQAALLPAGIATLLAVLAPILPRIDPRNRGYAGFRGTYYLIMNTIVLLFGFILYATVASALNWPFAGSRVFLAAMGLFMAVLGSELGRVEPNFFVGIRTPWTLADPWVWQQTHRRGGRWMAIGGSLGTLLALTLPDNLAFGLVFPVIIAPPLAAAVASYFFWRQRLNGSATGSGGPHE